jgi:hypothetical protein
MAGSPRLAVLRVALPATVVTGGMLLAACGSPASATSVTYRATAARAGNTLCASPGAVVGLQVSERDAQNRTRGPAHQPPAPVSVPSVAEARTIARTICELPPIAGPRLRCRTLAQVAFFQLRFSTKLGALPVVTIQVSGCSQVTGAGPVRSAKAMPAVAQSLRAIVHNEPPVIFAN